MTETPGAGGGDDRPVCSVVIPTYNGLALLESCLASIARHRPRTIPIEVIVADDCSTDATAFWLSAFHPWVRHVRLERNGGFCAAANAGVAAARGEFVQLLNNDTEVREAWIETGIAPFHDPSVGSVAPLVLVRSDPSRVDSAGDGYALTGWPYKRGHGEPADRWAAEPSGRVFGASASSAFYRASALKVVGTPFDPSYGSYYEDVDLAFRLRWAGFDCVYSPHCRILHDVSASYDHGRASLQRRVSRNGEILFWSNLPTRWLLAALAPHVGFTLIQAAWRALRGRPLPLLQGKWDALKQLPTLAGRRRMRADLARAAEVKPHFPLEMAAIGSLRNHLRRPKEATQRS